MNRKLVKTEDGSHTLHVSELGEHYHSIHGAVTESETIFIKAAFEYHPAKEVRVLEFGMGTGLNVLLSYNSAEKAKRKVFYHSIEKYPISILEADLLNLKDVVGSSDPALFDKIHNSEWDKELSLSDNFVLYKEKADFRETKPEGKFDVVYFDAFAPEIQPKLWTEKMFFRIYELMSIGGILSTYSAKGQVKRNLLSAGFSVSKIPGPPGKREFIRAVK